MYYQELTAARQEPLENKIISFVEKELKDYIRSEISTTDGAEVAGYAITQLMEGKS